MFNQHKFTLFVGIFISAQVISNVLATKLWIIGGITIPAGVLAYPITFLMTDIIGEIWGEKTVNHVVNTGLVCSILAVILGLLAVQLPAAPFYKSQEFFAQLFGSVGRITFAGLIAYIVSQKTDVWIFHRLREYTNTKHLWLRNNVATVISQLFDTVIFITVAFYGQMPLSLVGQMIIGQWVAKVIIALCDTPFCYLGVKWGNKVNSKASSRSSGK